MNGRSTNTPYKNVKYINLVLFKYNFKAFSYFLSLKRHVVTPHFTLSQNTTIKESCCSLN